MRLTPSLHPGPPRPTPTLLFPAHLQHATIAPRYPVDRAVFTRPLCFVHATATEAALVSITIVYETHSTSVDNERGVAPGWLPGRLSERGRAQARELGE